MSKSYYQTIDGIRYDRGLLEKAEALLRERGVGILQEEDVQKLLEDAQDGSLVTAVEFRTLKYIGSHFTLSPEAFQRLNEQLERETPIQRTISSIVRDVFGLKQLQWEIDDGEVEWQSTRLDNRVSFSVALREMLDHFLYGMDSANSFRDIALTVVHPEPDNWDHATDMVKALLDEGMLYLFSPHYLEKIEKHQLPFRTPPFAVDPKRYWVFGLRIPKLVDFYFLGYVSRQQWYEVYHAGYR